ncbi:MAG: gliding motility protein GldL [Prolixibacteraceae bacterium]|nr:gliding motility protein GldL [Prolixibacteraceae bacterium]
MNIGDFLHSRRWRLIQNYIYSWGASVVLMGALFKLEHLPGASIFLGVGLSIEAIIFFVSAFEPLMELPDWKKVYPQLRTKEDGEKNTIIYDELDKTYYRGPGKGTVQGGGESVPGIPDEQLSKLKDSLQKLSDTANGLSDLSSATAATEGFVKNMNEASTSIGQVTDFNKKATEQIGQTMSDLSVNYQSAANTVKESAGKASSEIDKSLNNLSSTVSSTAESMKEQVGKVSQGLDKTMSDMSGSVNESVNALKGNVEKASGDMGKTVNDLSASFKTTANNLKENGEQISSDLKQTGMEFSKKLNASADELTSSYKKMTGSLANGYKGLEKSAGKYVEGIDKLNKNLAAVNAAYEIHLKGAHKVEEMVKNYSGNVGEIGKLLETSVEETRKFNENTKEINDSIQALNKIYGRMLGALNNKK